MSTAIAETPVTIESNIFAVVEQARDLAKAHCSISVSAEQNYAIQQLYKNDVARQAATRNPVSVQNAMLNLSSIGISLNPALKHAYLVPRDGAICLDISYMGLMHLAQEIGSILWGQAKIVFANDTYENQGIDKQPKHTYSAFGERGEKVGVYCSVKLPNGDYLTEEMSAQQVEDVRLTSKSKDSKYSPWQTFPEEMWRKTVVKRASKYWPKSNGRLDTAIHAINQSEGMDTDKEEKEHLANVKKLEEYTAEKHTALELFGFVEQFKSNEEYYIRIYNSFPPGLKVSGKQKHRDGKNQFFDYLEIFKNGEESAINECREELTQLELKIIQAALKG